MRLSTRYKTMKIYSFGYALDEFERIVIVVYICYLIYIMLFLLLYVDFCPANWGGGRVANYINEILLKKIDLLYRY